MNHAQENRFVGVDVSKDKLTIAWGADGKVEDLSNSKRGIQALIRRLQKAAPQLVVFEPTGGYELALQIDLLEAGIPCASVNPIRAKAFARSSSNGAKTDPIDARMLANYGEKMEPRHCQPIDAWLLELRGLMQRRDQLASERTRELGRLESARGYAAKSTKRFITKIENEMILLEAKAKAMVEERPDVQHQLELLCSVHGVGFVTAMILITQLPELGSLDRKEIASLTGLAPIPDESGRKQGKRYIRGGRRRVRKALYMAALSAVGDNGPLRSFYRRLTLENGKSAKVALVAAARKLVCILNAIIRDERPYSEDPHMA